MISLLTLLAAAAQAGSSAGGDAAISSPTEPHRPPAGYELVFAEEFDEGEMPDADKWVYDTERNAQGWYNNELQYYAATRPENARIENGSLIIEARKEDLSGDGEPADFGGQDYTSARLISAGEGWTFGFYEVRAKLPCQRGTWPAIWMLPSDPEVEWPDGGEIDIMEHVGYDPGVIHHSVHTRAFNFNRGTQRTTSFKLETACERYHRYQLLWTPENLVFAVDDAPRFLFQKRRSDRARWPFDEPMQLILNVAIGGDWGGRHGVDDEALPARMEIDHVRIYQLAEERE